MTKYKAVAVSKNNSSLWMLIILIKVKTGCLIVNVTLLLVNSSILPFQN